MTMDEQPGLKPCCVPTRGGAVSAQAQRTTPLPNRLRTDHRDARADAVIVRHSPEVWFSARRPRRRGADGTSTRKGRRLTEGEPRKKGRGPEDRALNPST